LDALKIIIFIFLIALAVTGFSTPVVRRFSIWVGFVDLPAGRKAHREPMPLMGGLAIFAGAILAILVMYTSLPDRVIRGDPSDIDIPLHVAGTLLAVTVMAFLGLWDDRVELPPWAKFGGQIVAVAILVTAGVRVRLPIPEALNYFITVLWLLGITNALNFLDNMDGLTAGISAVCSAFILLLATQNNQYLVAGLAAAVLGACLGFLRYNFNPAKIFMGDAGALFLGFLLAVLGLQLRFPGNTSTVTWLVPIFILGLPIFDMTLVVLSRARRRRPPWHAGHDHVSHRLVHLGWTQREAVLILYLVTGASGMIGLFVAEADLVEAVAIALTTGLLSLYVIWWLDKWALTPRNQLPAKDLSSSEGT
jgi:UDP-GlcNAc:undecaprenyl-phosphate GlcNAc-1-phosphate transferase